jgi:hypothetical protein
MGVESHTLNYSEERASRVSSLCQKMKSTREKMETETCAFIEAAKSFSLEWVQSEMYINVSPLKSEGYSVNGETGKDRLSELSRPEGLPFLIQRIVEEHLNSDDYWIHRSELLHADISRDYIEFKKEKVRKDLTSSIRMILGCAAEIFADPKNENPEGRVWVKERGRRKYICILRFSDEMTVSLDHYFTMLEELLILGYEMKEIENEVGERGR